MNVAPDFLLQEQVSYSMRCTKICARNAKTSSLRRCYGRYSTLERVWRSATRPLLEGGQLAAYVYSLQKTAGPADEKYFIFKKSLKNINLGGLLLMKACNILKKLTKICESEFNRSLNVGYG